MKSLHTTNFLSLFSLCYLVKIKTQIADFFKPFGWIIFLKASFS